MIDKKTFDEIALPEEFREAFNTIRTNLYYALSGEKSKIIAVTGIKKDTGSSTVSLNLALSFAQIGKKVLLIDGDMRFGTLSARLDLSAAPGFSDCLSGKADINKCLVSMGGFNILPAGSESSTPANLLASPAMAEFCSNCRDNFDYIIIVFPPTALYTDAVVATELIDGFVPVIRDNFTAFSEIKRLLKQLNRVHANVLGFVYNRAHIKNKLKK